MDKNKPREDGSVLLKERTKLQPKKPGKYAVVILNDDYTPRDFVVWLLQTVFAKSLEKANQIMMEAHTTGKALCGIYTKDIANTMVLQVRNLADQYEFPLECRIEAVKEE
ncbi:ATP-dependent Clp protease adaptor ClpS [Leptospira sp. GIMC2001]|uniref:ATP-dependent Clp protease adaptor ClpS n=1 Tax=Leptospira sp. GIMC2001 TaxID=1513297 RepID=UPI00234BD2BA|nr:ATP-dependent Clp protease adaptor ClpS [Leptospira sp. GIMC2001]WCL50959.1 ATP-dependent Clp protease adaptor ClpS [Leptospira sp. GIMC2001]